LELNENLSRVRCFNPDFLYTKEACKCAS
jgi:hypothetical protein